MTERDLGLEKVTQLDICTGTAEDKTSDSPEGKHKNNFHFCILLNSCVFLLGQASLLSVKCVILESSVDDHLTMEDLIRYSFQVAKGMEFLSSRKVKSLVSWACIITKLYDSFTVQSYVSSVVYPQRFSSQEHPPLREQRGEDL